MTTDQCLLGIDLGTSSVKAALFSQAGRLISSASAEYPILRPQVGYAEQDPEAWWDAVCRTVCATMAEADDSLQVAAIGLSGQMHGTVLLGANGEPLAPAIIWPDQRSSMQVQEIVRTLGLERLTSIAGSPVATGFLAATLTWIRQERPEVWSDIKMVLLPKDYIRYRLMGEFATDPSDGSGSLLLDVRKRAWAPQLLEIVGISEQQLPGIMPSSAVAGTLCADGAEQMGLREGISIVTGAADTACSSLGAGVASPGSMLLTLSSGGQLVAPMDHVETDPLGRIHTFCSALEPSDGPGWYQMGAMLSAGLALRWLRDQVFAMPETDAYERMSAWAANSSLGSGGLLFLPYLTGERTPHMDPQARGVFLGLTASHERRDFVCAVMEGVAMACYDAFQVLSELGALPTSIVLAGGGAKSAVWRQIIADLFGLPVHPLAVSDQSAAGAALLAGSGIGLFDVATTAAAWASYGDVVHPNEENHARYADLFALFQGAYRQNVELLHQLDQWS